MATNSIPKLGELAISRTWAMPNSNTFEIEPIHNFVWKYLSQSRVSIDPFARNNRWATYTNDINPKTEAEYHMDAVAFLELMAKQGVRADLGIFDPPYSPRQISECYAEAGLSCSMTDTQGVGIYRDARNAMAEVLADDAVVLSFGWNTIGMGKKHGFKIENILLVCHGGAHNDTICMAERRAQSRFNFIPA